MKKDSILQEISLPESVIVSLDAGSLSIRGPKGEVRRELKQHKISIKIENQKIIIRSERSTRNDKKNVGSLVAHIKNMVRGCQQNHVYILKICSGHFPMSVSVSGGRLVVKNFLGEKVPRVLELKSDIDVKVHGDMIYVTSPSKELAGQTSASIEQLTRRPGYDGRVFQDGIWMISKDGKELK